MREEYASRALPCSVSARRVGRRNDLLGCRGFRGRHCRRVFPQIERRGVVVPRRFGVFALVLHFLFRCGATDILPGGVWFAGELFACADVVDATAGGGTRTVTAAAR